MATKKEPWSSDKDLISSLIAYCKILGAHHRWTEAEVTDWALANGTIGHMVIALETLDLPLKEVLSRWRHEKMHVYFWNMSGRDQELLKSFSVHFLFRHKLGTLVAEIKKGYFFDERPEELIVALCEKPVEEWFDMLENENFDVAKHGFSPEKFAKFRTLMQTIHIESKPTEVEQSALESAQRKWLSIAA